MLLPPLLEALSLDTPSMRSEGFEAVEAIESTTLDLSTFCFYNLARSLRAVATSQAAEPRTRTHA